MGIVFDMKQVVIDDLLVCYIDEGKGPVVLFLHGWGDSAATFTEQVKALRNSYRCIAIDLAGFGKSDPPKRAWRLSDYADYIKKICNKLGVSNDLYSVVGHSNGGAIAIKAISASYISPQKLVLLATSGIRPKRTGRAVVTKTIAKAGKILMIAAPKNVRERARRKLYTTIGSDYLIAPLLSETFKLVVAEDIRTDAEKIVQPTLLIYGTGDLDTPLEAVGTVLQRQIKGSQLIAIDGIGHFVQRDAPGEVNKAITKFLGTKQ
jgi:pimeloyl-ACP methyl ester carboxylesterase